MLDENQLTQILNLANENYYNQNSHVLTDNQYDILREHVLKIYPQNTVAKNQHQTIKITREQLKLPYSLMSMDKIKPDTKALKKYREKYKGPYIISHKLDGVSAIYSTETGTPKLYTRGNGFIGQSIDHLIEYLNLPTTLDISLRGELIINETVFKAKYNIEYANSRNFIAGLINVRKITEKHIEMLKDIDFVIYEVIKPYNLKPSEQFKYLQTLQPQPKIVINDIIQYDKLTNEYLSSHLLASRASSKYSIDGIIVNDDNVYPRLDKNPEHAFAFKMVLSEQEAETQVVDIIWTASKDGLLKPRIQIKPVSIGGTTINYATGFNAKFIVDNSIGVGAVVKIIRSGDVIPYIKSITTPADIPLMPTEEYIWNKTNVDIIIKNISTNSTVLIKQITKFFKTLEVDGLGEKNIERIINSGLKTIPQILAASLNDFTKVENFKIKMATRIYNSIHQKIDNAELSQIAAATNIFKRGLGEKTIKTILLEIPDIFTQPQSKEEQIKSVNNIKGLGKKTAIQFIENIPQFVEFINNSNLTHLFETKTKQTIIPKNNKLLNMNIVFSGTKDKILIKQLEDNGAKIQPSVTKSTNLLIIKNDTTITTKLAEAKLNNIPIITIDAFKTEYNL